MKFNAEAARVLYEEFKEKTPSHKTMTAPKFWKVYMTWLEHELRKARKRYELAENYIEESPCDPDIRVDQLRAYHEWLDFKKVN
jgi:hypothetical protein